MIGLPPTVGENLALGGPFVSPITGTPIEWDGTAALVSVSGAERFPVLAGEVPDLRAGGSQPTEIEIDALRARLAEWWDRSEREPAPAEDIRPDDSAEARAYWRVTARSEVSAFLRWCLRGRPRYRQRNSMALYRTVTDVYPSAARRTVHVLVDGCPATTTWLEFKRVSLEPVLRLIRREGVRSVLDFGCGWGVNTIHLMREAPDVEVWAFDASPYRVLSAQFNVRHLGLVPYRLFVADGSRLPLPDGAVDLVVTTHVLEQMSEVLSPALAEIRRVARRFAVHVEPTWRHARWPHRLRMRRLGYPRDIAERSVALGWKLVDRRLASPAWGRTPGELIVLEK